MLANILAFLGSLFNLFIDTIYKIGLAIVVTFLCAIVIACGFAALLIWMLT